MTGTITGKYTQRNKSFHLFVHEGLVSLTQGEGADKERGVINDFNICFNIGAVTYFIP